MKKPIIITLILAFVGSMLTYGQTDGKKETSFRTVYLYHDTLENVIVLDTKIAGLQPIATLRVEKGISDEDILKVDSRTVKPVLIATDETPRHSRSNLTRYWLRTNTYVEYDAATMTLKKKAVISEEPVRSRPSWWLLLGILLLAGSAFLAPAFNENDGWFGSIGIKKATMKAENSLLILAVTVVAGLLIGTLFPKLTGIEQAAVGIMIASSAGLLYGLFTDFNSFISLPTFIFLIIGDLWILDWLALTDRSGNPIVLIAYYLGAILIGSAVGIHLEGQAEKKKKNGQTT